MIYAPVRLDRVAQGLTQVTQDIVGPSIQVHWAYTQQSREAQARDMVVLTMTQGPTAFSRQRAYGRVQQVVTEAQVQVSGAAVGDRALIAVNCVPYFFDVLPGQTDADIASLLATTIQADYAEGLGVVQASATGDTITLTPDQGSDGNVPFYELGIRGPLVSASTTTEDRYIQVTDGTRVMLIDVQAYSKERTIYGGAMAILAAIEAGYQSVDYSETLATFGMGFFNRAGSVTDLSAIAGANWETRATLPVEVATRSISTRPVEVIETVNLNTNLQSIGGASVLADTIIVPVP